MNIPIIYEDDWLLVVNKPSGFLVIPTPKKEKHTLTGILNDEVKKRGLFYRLHPCHRLDRETSGLIIYAKGKSVQKKMMGLFKKRRVSKTYIAFVQGNLARQKGSIEIPLEGVSAITKYELIERRRNFDILRVMPITGRTNQIRIHFKAIGHPLVGESRFAFRKDYKLRAKRVCLHSEILEFVHPITNKQISFVSELGSDLKEFLNKHPN